MVKTLEDKLVENKQLYMERTHYSLQLKEHLNSMREEAAIQVTKIKDFAECQKGQYADYIQLLEQQLAKSRAQACAELKKRDQVSSSDFFQTIISRGNAIGTPRPSFEF